MLEMSWYRRARLLPHSLHQHSKCVRQVSLIPEWVLQVHLLHVHLVLDEVFVHVFQIRNHLQGRIHIAGVAQVVKSTSLSNDLEITVFIDVSALLCLALVLCIIHLLLS